MTKMLGVLVPILTLLVVLAVPAPAQPPPVFSEVYHATLRRMVVDWNERRVPLSKSGLDPLFRQNVEPVLERRISQPYFGFENTTWFQESIAQWRALPNPLVPQRGISRDAALLLEILYRNNLQDFSRRVAPNEASIRSALRLPWFLILGTAQQRARDQITTTEIVFAVSAYFTGIYPFCPR
jgi:hypothetical protein